MVQAQTGKSSLLCLQPRQPGKTTNKENLNQFPGVLSSNISCERDLGSVRMVLRTIESREVCLWKAAKRFPLSKINRSGVNGFRAAVKTAICRGFTLTPRWKILAVQQVCSYLCCRILVNLFFQKHAKANVHDLLVPAGKVYIQSILFYISRS